MADEVQATTDAAPPAGTDNPEPDAQEPQEVSGLPDWAQALIHELRDENAGHRKAKQAAEEAAQQAKEERLAQQEEWQQLAEQRQARLAELEPLSDEVKRYRDALTSHVEAQRATVPDAINSLLERLDPLEQLQWLTEHAGDLNKPSAPSLDAGVGSDAEPQPHMTAEQKQFIGDVLGVNPDDVPDDIDGLT